MDYKELQLKICKKYGLAYYDTPVNLKVGISLNVQDGKFPINGLRHPPQGDTTGWYIWATEDFSESPDFFKPLHVIHLEDWCPIVIPYLGLPPGFRFLITPDYEDIWEDLSLLDI